MDGGGGWRLWDREGHRISLGGRGRMERNKEG